MTAMREYINRQRAEEMYKMILDAQGKCYSASETDIDAVIERYNDIMNGIRSIIERENYTMEDVLNFLIAQSLHSYILYREAVLAG